MPSLALAALLFLSAPAWSRAEALSPGCGSAPPTEPPAELVLDGATRDLIVVVPDSYRPDRPHRLVVAFHGRTTPADRARRYYGLEGAAADDTIFVYPQALRQADGTFIWRLPEDLALFDTIVARLAEAYCIATDSVFAVGHSLGASFVNSLACARGPTLRAVATVAGGMAPVECRGQVAALLLHNPEDRLVPIELGRAVRDRLLAQNGLPRSPAAVYPHAFNCRRHGSGRAENPVIWCPHDRDRTRSGRYYPHQWPQGTGAFIMDFFGALG